MPWPFSSFIIRRRCVLAFVSQSRYRTRWKRVASRPRMASPVLIVMESANASMDLPVDPSPYRMLRPSVVMRGLTSYNSSAPSSSTS